jgi:hypothetical protein
MPMCSLRGNGMPYAPCGVYLCYAALVNSKVCLIRYVYVLCGLSLGLYYIALCGMCMPSVVVHAMVYICLMWL